ncbi:aldo/keto reductase [Gleimia sp. 6138-11-ORH1]|uniref:aldo/keto reductase n=1 Tax=Gleimia sp. 6138-11-ORH1 TaxID=2973937 RepID=UPI002167B366|nr:aldo/keto reductase [Gleimia sp. 6138-11-ORH1]MCS4484283.1 aldo/keto reductase [Gleimia sp. 6138-11-ORH1]
MQQRFLGSTGLAISTIGLGTLTWGRDTRPEEARAIWKAFADSGGNLIDTSPTYGEGQAEATIGELLTHDFPRSETILISKGGFFQNEGRLRAANNRNAILNSLDASLKALKTDYLDILLLSRPDPHTPLAESLAAIEIAVKSGRVRYFGLANFPVWDTASAWQLSQQLSLPLATVSAEYSLLNREVETQLLPALEANGIGFIGWSGLARGVLTGKYRHGTPPDSRGASSTLAGFVTPYLGREANAVVEGVMTAAKGLDYAPWDVALQWALSQPAVSSILVGPRTELQAQQILSGVELTVPPQILEALDQISV